MSNFPYVLVVLLLLSAVCEPRPPRVHDDDAETLKHGRRITRKAAPEDMDMDMDSEESYDSSERRGDHEDRNRSSSNALSSSMVIPASYDKLQVPQPLEEPPDDTYPLNVHLIVDVRNAAIEDELNEVISLDCDVSLTWDDKVIYDANKNRTGLFPRGRVYTALNPAFLNRIWTPDVIIENMDNVKVHKIVRKAKKLIYLNTGKFIYKFRATFHVKCDFELLHYPADTQRCQIQMSTFAHPPTDVILVWDVLLFDVPNDPNFDFDVTTLMENERCDEPKPREPVWYAQFDVLARRKMSYHLMQTYIPSCLYIAITWLCFMIPRNLCEGRIAVAMTTLLTLTSMFASVRESTPAVSYVKAIDIWIVACIAFVFGTLLHFSMLLWTRASHMSDEELTAVKKDTRRKREMLKGIGIAIVEFVEDNAFITIAIIVVAFNVSYWTWLFTASGYFDWNSSMEARLYNKSESMSTCNHPD